LCYSNLRNSQKETKKSRLHIVTDKQLLEKKLFCNPTISEAISSKPHA
jgi:hypothetical protein